MNIMDAIMRLLTFEPGDIGEGIGDIGKGIGDILDKVQFICLVVLGILLILLVLWILSHVFGSGGRG